MNKELLTTIKRLALDDPEHFDMETFADDCGTTCCIAGLAVKIAEPETFNAIRRRFIEPARGENEEWVKAGSRALDIDDKQANRLFYHSNWPEAYRWEYERLADECDMEEAAEVAAQRIDHFIATEGRE